VEVVAGLVQFACDRTQRVCQVRGSGCGSDFREVVAGLDRARRSSFHTISVSPLRANSSASCKNDLFRRRFEGSEILSICKLGDFVASTGIKDKDGKIHAIEVRIFPAATPDGGRQFGQPS
jgi:hypothetical protein